MEAFIIFSIVWAFGSILNDTAKKDLDSKLREVIVRFKSDFESYAR
jgi:hypothetical protein